MVCTDVDGTTQVDTVAMDKISIPAKPDGQALSCPSLSGVVARAADSFALSRRCVACCSAALRCLRSMRRVGGGTLWRHECWSS